VAIDEETGARLAAYLDEELDEDGRRQVETLVQRDEGARQALEQMRRARRVLREYDTRTGATTAEVTPAPVDISGRGLDHFLVESRIAQGGMGEVYRATDTSLERPVAIKLISPALAARPDLAERFVREARLQAQIDHPHVAHVYHVGRHEGRLYFAMEYLPGGSLEDRLQESNTLEPDEAIDVVVEVADILESTRKRGIVHRDLKPSNIMFTGDGKIKLTDFGLSKPTGEEATHLTQSGAVLGTPHYISPEAATGAEVTWKSDMYSLGCTLYRLLIGRPPFRGHTPVQLALAHVREPFPEPETVPPGVSPELMDVLRCMMEKEPEERFADYPSLINALNAARPKVIEPISPWRRVGVGVLDGLVAVGITIVFVFLVAGALVTLGMPRPAVERLSPLLIAFMGVVCMGVIPALSGSTLIQGIFAMKVRPERLKGRGRKRLLLRGMVANPVATVGLMVLPISALPEGKGRGLLFLFGAGTLLVWHVADFAAAFFDDRRRFLHDILFRTRLQHVTYR